jgi:hypothetical protein
MAVRQCPRCDLRFRDEAELRSHLGDDHGLDPEALERHLGHSGSSVHRRPPAPTHVVHADPHRRDR